ncbi:hypothetical protein ACP4OV_014585 [Aristida adscensionis]
MAPSSASPAMAEATPPIANEASSVVAIAMPSSVKEEEPQPQPPPPPPPPPESRYSLGVPCLVLVSVVFAVLTPWLLWRAAGQPTAFVWTGSLLACSYLVIGTVCLSCRMGFAYAFFRVSYVLLLGFAAANLVGAVRAAAVASLATFGAAWMFGYAVGEHRQLVGAEWSAVAVVRHHPSWDDDHKAWFLLICSYIGAVTLATIARMAWLIAVPASACFLQSKDDHTEEALFVVMELAVEAFVIVGFWSIPVAVNLLERQVIFSMGAMSLRVLGIFAASILLNSVLSHAVGNAAGLLVFWVMAMGMAAFLGYGLAVHAWCEDLRARLSERRKKQAASANSNLSQDRLNEPAQQLLLPNQMLDEETDHKVVCSLFQEIDERNQKPGQHVVVDIAQ